MTTATPFEIFLVAVPGLEPVLLDEVRAAGWPKARLIAGGVAIDGDWADVWRANLVLRGATRVLARIGSFMAFHLAQLDKRARKFPWTEVLRPDVPLRVEVTARKSKIYHAGAATQRIETALNAAGFQITADAPVALKVRIEDNRVTLSVDTSGESLHKRGHKEAVAKAPLRETMAALMLRACGYSGDEPVLDLMCGAGTFPIEAAEITLGLNPGRSRDFAFGHLATFDPAAWATMRAAGPSAPLPDWQHRGRDRDPGAIRMSTANAGRAGVSALCQFDAALIAEAMPPPGPHGLIMLNPPYGGRIGKPGALGGLYASIGEVLRDRFSGWRVGLVTTDLTLARATRLPFDPPGAPIAHGGLKVRLFRSPPLR